MLKNPLDSIKMNSPIGTLTIAASKSHLTHIVNDVNIELLNKYTLRTNCKNKILINTEKQLTEYFESKRTHFDLPIDLTIGTSFQQKSWTTLQKIQFGKTIAYKKQAEILGDVKKARAVGSANGKNPILIVIPCHRVISSTGGLGGYSAGLNIKKQLLAHEQGLHTFKS